MAEEKFVPFSSPEARNLLRPGPTRANLPPPAQGEDDFVPFAQVQRPVRDYSWSEVPAAARQNLPRSARQFYGDVATAVLNPIDTAVATAQLAGGAALAALPEGAQNWLMSVGNNPERMQQSIDMARAAGGFYADRYGSMAGFRRALAEDPVSVAADFSALLSGGAGATARVAPTASRTLQSAADLTNPLMPLAALPEAKVPGTGRTVGQNLSVAGGTLWDAVTGQGGDRVARNIITQALGEQNIPTIAQLSDPQFRNMPAGEAVLAAGVNRPQFQALARDIAQEDMNNVFFQQEQARPVARQEQLAGVTPDLEQAQTARAQATDPLYRSAREQPVLVTENLRNTIEGLPSNILNSARRLAKTDPRGPGDIDLDRMVLDGRTLNYIRAAIRDELQKPPSERIATTTERRFLGQRLQELTREFEAQVPEFQQARTTFAEMSAPVNQATILNEMQRRLTGPMDQERPGQFMRVLGEGEEALIRTSTGAPRFQQGDLMRILTEEQGRAVTEVSDQLRRERQMDIQARRGAPGLQRIVEQNRPLGFRFPNILNREIMIANRTLNVLEGKVSDATRSALERAMLSGENLNEFINSRPITERGLIRDALSAANEAANIDQFRNLGLIEQLTDEEQPFRAELRGMAR